MGASDFGRGGRVLKYSGRERFRGHVLKYSGPERFRARRACFEIMGVSYFRRGEGVLPTMVYELFGTCHYGRGEGALG